MSIDIEYIRNYRLISNEKMWGKIIEVDKCDEGGTTWGSGSYYEVLEELENLTSLSEDTLSTLFPIIDWFQSNTEMEHSEVNKIHAALKDAERQISLSNSLLHSLYEESLTDSNKFSHRLKNLLHLWDNGYVVYYSY